MIGEGFAPAVGEGDGGEPVGAVRGHLGVAVAVYAPEPETVLIELMDHPVELAQLPAGGGPVELAFFVARRDGGVDPAREAAEFPEGGGLRDQPDVGVVRVRDDPLGVVVAPVPSEGLVPGWRAGEIRVADAAGGVAQHGSGAGIGGSSPAAPAADVAATGAGELTSLAVVAVVLGRHGAAEVRPGHREGEIVAVHLAPAGAAGRELLAEAAAAADLGPEGEGAEAVRGSAAGKTSALEKAPGVVRSQVLADRNSETRAALCRHGRLVEPEHVEGAVGVLGGRPVVPGSVHVHGEADGVGASGFGEDLERRAADRGGAAVVGRAAAVPGAGAGAVVARLALADGIVDAALARAQSARAEGRALGVARRGQRKDQARQNDRQRPEHNLVQDARPPWRRAGTCRNFFRSN